MLIFFLFYFFFFFFFLYFEGGGGGGGGGGEGVKNKIMDYLTSVRVCQILSACVSQARDIHVCTCTKLTN